ncbi:hypothetical protein AMECASPLE_024497 [Ameca splendens]|uniref:Uncharacterized protein n=1 Tax=Ameca splendens TaxID=208324 RepID=A0ABV0XTB0_9TELE
MPHKAGHMTNMPNHPRTMGQSQQSTQSPMPGIGPQPQPGMWGNKTRPTTRQRPPTNNTRPKMAGPPKCRQMNRDHPGKTGSQADPAMHHPAHHHAQGKDASPASRRAAQKGHSTHSNHQHPCQPSKNDRAKPSCGSPRANATATPHIIPYIGRGTVKTTNPKHPPPTRNHPADRQTPPQHKAQNPNATTEPSDASPATPTHRGQSHHAQEHHPNNTAHQTAEDRTQQ